MSALSIQPTYPIFTETDGQPLENGYIWLGVANLDPQGNPINVYWDAALTQLAGQPIRTQGGYPVNSGTPARLYVNSDYSIRVMNKNGNVVYSAPAATERYSNLVLDGIDASNVTYDPPYTGSVATNVESSLAQVVSVKDFGAIGDGFADDTAAFIAATATGNPVFVPFTQNFYSVSALSADQIKSLFGPGTVKIAGNLQWISSSPNPLTDDAAGLSYVNANFQPSKWPSVDGSLRNGAKSVTVTRTGGFGSYGLNLTEYLVTAEIVSPQFDVGQTAWVSSTNLNGGQVFGSWFGANTPSSELLQTYPSGNVIGMEVNVGNRWGDFGLQSDINVLRCTVGQQIVPDVLPSQDGGTVNIYPGTFGQVFGQSIHGHKWWTATLIRTDSIMPNGIAHQANGGSTALLAPASWSKISNNWGYGLDMGSATFANAPINVPFSSVSTTATTGGVGSLPPQVQGYLKFAVSGTIVKVPYYNN